MRLLWVETSVQLKEDHEDQRGSQELFHKRGKLDTSSHTVFHFKWKTESKSFNSNYTVRLLLSCVIDLF